MTLFPWQVPESAARSGPKFFLVEHTVKAGRGDEFWGALGELMGDQEKFAAQKVEQTGLGIKVLFFGEKLWSVHE